MKTSLAFVDDHPALLRGVASLFDERHFEVLGTASNAEGLCELARVRCPNVIVVDLSMPGDVFSAITEASRAGSKVVVFTAYADTALALRALEAGALAFVLKGRPSEDLFEAIRSVQAGELFISPNFSAKVISALRAKTLDDPTAARGPDLSTRERQIVDGLLRAKTNKEIARELDLSEKTIKHYMTNLMAKLGAKNRLDVVLAIKRAHDEPHPGLSYTEAAYGGR